MWGETLLAVELTARQAKLYIVEQVTRNCKYLETIIIIE
jgi:hypothetical protein